MSGFVIDAADRDFVVVCRSLGCPWRGVAFDRVTAWRQAAEHERRAHPGQLLASNALTMATRRARR